MEIEQNTAQHLLTATHLFLLLTDTVLTELSNGLRRSLMKVSIMYAPIHWQLVILNNSYFMKFQEKQVNDKEIFYVVLQVKPRAYLIELC